MTFYITVIIICIFFQAERGVFDFISYTRLFKQLKNRNPDAHLPSKKNLFILIPVLHEQEIIEETILNFFRINQDKFEIKVVILTSIREKAGGNLTTEEVVTRSTISGKLSPFKDHIFIYQDPMICGNMATQLNYAIEKIRDVAEPDTFYVVYNADSMISETIFERISELFSKYPNREFAFQQPCAFVRDMNQASNQFTNAMSLYQSWYCLGHESRLIRNYSARSEKKWGEKNGKLGVVVGHGSGLTFNIHASNHGYPSDLLTEDLTFGFILSTNNVPILSLPALEIADVPNRFPTFIKQKSVWFWNFLGYNSCYKKMRAKGHSRLILLPLLLQGLGAGAYWFFDTFFIVIPFIISIILQSYTIAAIALASFIVFYIIPQYVLLRKLPAALESQEFIELAQNVRKVSFIKLFPSLCLIILTNSVGAWIATFKSINYLITGNLPTKYKTGD